MDIFRGLKLAGLLLVGSVSLYSKADWTILFYGQGNNDLGQFIRNNVRDMARVGSNEKLNILVQLDQPDKDGLWRYKIEKDKIEFIGCVPSRNGASGVDEFVDAARWAFSSYPSKHKGLIASNHGSGSVDPRLWSNHSLARNEGSCDTVNLSTRSAQMTPQYRGILFDYERKTYMTNCQQIEALSKIKREVLGGNKLDFIGYDACFMAMCEQMYQVRDYAKFFVASEEVEHARGWLYAPFLHHAAKGDATPLSLVQNIVSAYDRYYKNKMPWYTQSAVNLDSIDTIKHNIDEVVRKVQACRGKYGLRAIKAVVRQARGSSLQFNTPCYVDLYSFYTALYHALDKAVSRDVFVLLQGGEPERDILYDACGQNLAEFPFSDEEMILGRWDNDSADDWCMPHNSADVCDFLSTAQTKSIGIQPEFEEREQVRSSLPEVEALKEELKRGMELIDAVVVANVTGYGVLGARGLSIYFPRYNIDNSYPKTDFAKSSLWPQFLKDMM